MTATRVLGTQPQGPETQNGQPKRRSQQPQASRSSTPGGLQSAEFESHLAEGSSQ